MDWTAETRYVEYKIITLRIYQKKFPRPNNPLQWKILGLFALSFTSSLLLYKIPSSAAAEGTCVAEFQDVSTTASTLLSRASIFCCIFHTSAIFFALSWPLTPSTLVLDVVLAPAQ